MSFKTADFSAKSEAVLPIHDESHYLVTYTVNGEQKGLRLDQFLKVKYPKRSREKLKDAIETDKILISRPTSRFQPVGKLKASTQVMEGDEVQVYRERFPEPEVDLNYTILFEDDVLFVISKPANLPVHPAGKYYFNTLLTHLKTQGYTKPIDGDHDFFLAHRIDRETSGVLVLTKTSASCAAMAEQFAARTTEKKYLAIVKGEIEEESFTIDAPLDRSKTSRLTLKMEVTPAGEGYASATGFKKLKTAGGYTLVACYPKTGRQHQIRVHLAHHGFPIVGDKIYSFDERESEFYFGGKKEPLLSPELQARLEIPRHALHATGLRFTHPVTKKPLQFLAPLTEDLIRFFEEKSGESLDRGIFNQW